MPSARDSSKAGTKRELFHWHTNPECLDENKRYLGSTGSKLAKTESISEKTENSHGIHQLMKQRKTNDTWNELSGGDLTPVIGIELKQAIIEPCLGVPRIDLNLV